VGFVICALLLAVPLAHQIVGHRVHRKVLQAVVRHNGLELPPTRHELNHAARSLPLRIAADVGWLIYVAGVALLAYSLR
jgi:hypothetical protein